MKLICLFLGHFCTVSGETPAFVCDRCGLSFSEKTFVLRRAKWVINVVER